MIFRDPPLPETPSFSVFGKPRSMSLHGVVGKLGIEDRFVGIDAPSDLKFSDIQKINVRTGVLSLPYPSTQAAANTSIIFDEFQASVSLNGKSQNLRSTVWTPMFTWLDRVVAYLTFVPILIAFVGWLRAKDKNV